MICGSIGAPVCGAAPWDERRLSEDPKTLEELSQVYDVSRERIRQIEVRAFEKLQKSLINIAGERRLLPIAA